VAPEAAPKKRCLAGPDRCPFLCPQFDRPGAQHRRHPP
jgi:hypothetical protein